MKKLTFILLTVATSLAFINCSSDDDNGSEDCFDCKMIITSKYCYTEGDKFYRVTVAGQTENVPLNGASWSEVKSGLEQLVI